jgi:hypothetical protein
MPFPLRGGTGWGWFDRVITQARKALDHLSLWERSTRASAAGEGLQVYPERAYPLTRTSRSDLSPWER